MAVEVDLRARTVLVTGHHPLLAGALVDRLLGDGHRVLVPAPPLLPGLTVLRSWPRSREDAPVPEVVEHDPEDPDVPAPLHRGVDVVLHLDTGPVGDDLAMRSTAVLDTLFALRVAELNGARLVVASVDGDGGHTATLEGLVAGYLSAHEVDTVVARVTDCYGPDPAGSSVGVVSRLVAAALATGTVVVDARDRRSHTPCFVDDVVSALLGLGRLPGADAVAPAAADRPGPVHVGPAAALSTTELAEQVCRATGADVRLVGLAPLGTPAPTPVLTPARPAPSAAPGSPVRPDEPAATAGWRPRVDLAEGLRRCVAATGGPGEQTAPRPAGVEVA